MPSEIQTKILRAIRDFQNENSYSPSFRDIKDMTDYTSVAGIYNNIDKLVRDGYVTRDAGKARSILVTRRGEKYLDVADNI